MEDLNVGVEGHVFDFDFVVDGEGVVGHVAVSFLDFSFLLDRRSFDPGGLTVVTGKGDCSIARENLFGTGHVTAGALSEYGDSEC